MQWVMVRDCSWDKWLKLAGCRLDWCGTAAAHSTARPTVPAAGITEKLVWSYSELMVRSRQSSRNWVSILCRCSTNSR